MRPGGAPVPNFFVPMVQQGQQGQRPGGRRGAVQQPVPLMPGVAGGMFSVPYDVGGMPLRDASLSQQIPIGALASHLANASPEQQRTVGSSLPLVFTLLNNSSSLA